VKLPAWLAASAALCGCAAAHAYPARPVGPVLDLADVMPATGEAALNYRLIKYYDATGNSLVVVTVNSLEGQTIEQYAKGLFNEWGIGDAKTDRGLLILVAPTEHKVRIEVGCGLEGRITNDLAAKVIRDAMVPRYIEGDLEGGTLAGVDALVADLNNPATANDNVRTTPICRAKAKAAA
jgi:uncharacterized protein